MNKTRILAVRILVIIFAVLAYHFFNTSPPPEVVVLFMAAGLFLLVMWVNAESSHEEYGKATREQIVHYIDKIPKITKLDAWTIAGVIAGIVAAIAGILALFK